MNYDKKITEFTESEFLNFVRSIFDPTNTTENEDVDKVLYFEKITEHPDGADIIFYPSEGQEDSPEGVVKIIKEWRAANGKPGFKSE